MNFPKKGTEIFPAFEVGGKKINLGRIIRFLLGSGVVVFAVWLLWRRPDVDWKVILMLLVSGSGLIDPTLPIEIAAAWKGKRNGTNRPG